jgi:hypothetical protein
MNPKALNTLRDLIQEDIGRRGLRNDPVRNLVNACPDDFEAACRSIAEHPRPALGVVTGFFIPHAQPPAGETDGPPGALFLARALAPQGIPVVLLTDVFCRGALQAGLEECGLKSAVQVLTLPGLPDHWPQFLRAGWLHFARNTFKLTHLVAVERPGPSHTLETLQAQLGPGGSLGETYLRFLHEVPTEDQDRYHNMVGRDITQHCSPAHWLFESLWPFPDIKTIGIGDGGNEIGMGKVSWDVIRANIPGGARIACRIATDYLIVCGISNWGAYALGAAVLLIRGTKPAADLFSPAREEQLLRLMVERGPLVDGVLGRPAVTVDGISFERYVEPLRKMGALLA